AFSNVISSYCRYRVLIEHFISHYSSNYEKIDSTITKQQNIHPHTTLSHQQYRHCPLV
ncbi:hypothetical protein L9F63_009947, partial [Diploptera punctata]